MNIEIAALRAIVAEKGISIETVISTIQTALLPRTGTPRATSRTLGSTSTEDRYRCG